MNSIPQGPSEHHQRIFEIVASHVKIIKYNIVEAFLATAPEEKIERPET